MLSAPNFHLRKMAPMSLFLDGICCLFNKTRDTLMSLAEVYEWTYLQITCLMSLCNLEAFMARIRTWVAVCTRITYVEMGYLYPGETVSVGHFQSWLLGHTFNSHWGPSAEKFIGGCIFVDLASCFLHVEHQVGFSEVEMDWAKHSYERLCMEHGNIV